MAETELKALVTAWRKEAGQLRERYGLGSLAQVCEAHANELAAAISRYQMEQLTLKDASALSGYSTSHLRALIADGTLTNAGRKGSPRLLRGELPRKTAVATVPVSGGQSRTKGFDAAAAAQSAMRRMHGKQQNGETAPYAS
ncbi:MAG TPA: hypothetical protein VFJ82_14935 [Longimicrobium sp.]|nr:hypothetical protein [Longimicrobium sp.]